MRISWFFSEGAFMCREYYLHKRPNGMPTGKEKATKPIVEAASLETIIKAIRKLELSADDALKIVSGLRDHSN